MSGSSGQTILVLVKTRNEKPSSCSAVGTTCRNMALLVCLLRKTWPTVMWRWMERFLPYHFTVLIWTGEKQKSVQSSWHRSHGTHSTPPFNTGGNVAHWALSMGRRCLKSIWGGRRKGDSLNFLLQENVGRTAFHWLWTKGEGSSVQGVFREQNIWRSFWHA